MKSLKDKAYEVIRERIITCVYQPGDVVDEKALCEELNMSRTPVREALNVLAEEEFLDIMPRRAIIVSQISMKDINNIYDLRELLEPDSAAIAVRRCEQYVMNNLLKEFKNSNKLDIYQYSILDNKLHMYIAQCTGNHILVKFMDSLMSKTQRIRIISSKYEERRVKGYTEHIDIINSILEGKEDAARNAMKDHLQEAREDFTRVLEANGRYCIS